MQEIYLLAEKLKFWLATKDFFGSHAQSPHLTEVRLWTELERVKNNSCGKNTDARSIEKGSLLSRSNSDLPLKPILGVMRKVRIWQRSDIGQSLLERVKNNSCGKNTDARSIETGSLLSRSHSDSPLKPFLGVMRKVRFRQRSDIGQSLLERVKHNSCGKKMMQRV